MMKRFGCCMGLTSRQSFNDFPFEIGADPLKTFLHFVDVQSDFQTMMRQDEVLPDRQKLI